MSIKIPDIQSQRGLAIESSTMIKRLLLNLIGEPTRQNHSKCLPSHEYTQPLVHLHHLESVM